MKAASSQDPAPYANDSHAFPPNQEPTVGHGPRSRMRPTDRRASEHRPNIDIGRNKRKMRHREINAERVFLFRRTDRSVS
ncbi:hypothetical protein GCM10009602_16800 [Nocardiopsis tropica]